MIQKQEEEKKKNQSTDTDLKMTKVTELENKDFKTMIMKRTKQ